MKILDSLCLYMYAYVCEKCNALALETTIDAERRCCFAHMLSASQDGAAFEDLVRQLDENEAAAASAPPKAAPARRQSLYSQQLLPTARVPVAKLEQPLGPAQEES